MKHSGSLSRSDWISAAVLWAATVAVFAAGAGRLGFYGDDAGWFSYLPRANTAEDLWKAMRYYMPGRNLHVFWHWSLYKMVGDPAAHLTAMHLVQSSLDGLVVAAFFFLLRLLDLPRAAAAIAAGLFAFWPIHGETHFWLESLPMNLLSTLFVILFAITSVALVRSRRGWWLWLLDGALFVGALFTYDQVFLVLLVIGFVRVAAVRQWRFALRNLPHLGAVVLCIVLRMTMGGGPKPRWHNDLAHDLGVVYENVRFMVLSNFGTVAADQIASLYGRAAGADWALALVAAAAVAMLGVWFRPGLSGQARVSRLFILVLGALFYLAAYLPLWLWWLAPRHHFLPSVGLFAGLAVVVAWVMEKIRVRAVQVALVLASGGATFVLAAASRGESWCWEQSFAARRELFRELEADLRGKEVLVLEDFPGSLGPAQLVTPHDPEFGPWFLARNSFAGNRPFRGALSGTPAPGGIFVGTDMRPGSEGFRYYPAREFLIVRFAGWEGGRMKYEKNPGGIPYQVLSSRVAPARGEFSIHEFSARRESGGLIVSLRIEAHQEPHGSLAAVFGYQQDGRFVRWGRTDPEGDLQLLPVLVSNPEAGLAPGAYEWSTTVRLESFPETDRVEAEIFEAGGHNHLLGRAETSVTP